MRKIFTLCAAMLLILSTATAQQRRVPMEKMGPVTKTIRAIQTPEKSNARIAKSAKTVITSFPYSEGFENGTADWTFIDSDNDNYNWTVYDSTDGRGDPHSGSKCVFSYSYDNNEGVLTPDNWMISSQMQIPAGSSFVLTWYDATQDPNYPSEYYSVYIATTNTIAGFTATTPVFSTTLTTSDWTKRTVDLSAYAGQNIYIAFRHHNSSDWFAMKIDDINVGAPTGIEVTLNGPTNVMSNTSQTYTATCDDPNATIHWILDGVLLGNQGTTYTNTWSTAGTHVLQAYATNNLGSDTASLNITVFDCGVITTLPWEEGFEAGDNTCWTFIDNDQNGNNWTISSNHTYNGNYCLYVSYNSTQDDDWAISQPITIPANMTSAQLSWYVAASSYFEETYEVRVSTTGNTVSDFTDSIFGETYGGSHVKRIVSLSNYAGQTIRIAFRHLSTDMFYLAIDDVRIGGLEAPENVTISGPVEVQVGETATYIASAIGEEITYNWHFYNGTPSFATGDTVTVSWATPGQYSVELHAQNNVGVSHDTLTVNVYDCNDITTFPYAINFQEHQSLMCWTPIDANNDGSTWYLYDGVGAVNFSYDMENDDAITPNDYLVSPAIVIPATGNYEFYFRTGAGSSQAFAEHYSVYVSTGNTASDFTTPLFSETFANGYAQEHTLSLADYAGQTIYIAFRHHDCSDQLAIVLANVEVRAMTAPTVTINAPSIAQKNQTVTLTAVAENTDSYSWTIEGATPSTANTETVDVTWANAGTYNISVTATNAAGSNTATATITIISCDPISTFPYSMGFESNEDISCWTLIDADGDSFNWTKLNDEQGFTGHNGSTGLMISESYSYMYSVPLTPDNWMFTPAIEVPANTDLKFSWWAKAQDSDYPDENYAVYVTTSVSTTGLPAPVYEGLPNGDWEQHSFDLSAYSGQTIYVAFRHYNVTDMFLLDIDDILISSNVGIETAEDANINLYPNPTTGKITVEGEGIITVEILDINGRTVMSHTNGGVIDMSNLANGIYMVRTVTNNGVSVKKIVKK
ncbi:MAG: choice-of-anchor J domain-containing protein [Bacteroidales bacterium]|nr:choice-of-anchor J domain-containing protein [Bacteroidales bacterium]